MDEKELKQYCRRAKKHLFCGAGERAQFEQYICFAVLFDKRHQH